MSVDILENVDENYNGRKILEEQNKELEKNINQQVIIIDDLNKRIEDLEKTLNILNNKYMSLASEYSRTMDTFDEVIFTFNKVYNSRKLSKIIDNNSV